MPPESSIATLSQLCATKFRVTQPDAFGLYLYKDQGYQRLPPGALAHRLSAAGYLVYRRAERPETQGPAREKKGCEGAEAGSWGEKKGVWNSRGESETTNSQVSGHVQPGEQETEGSQAAEE